MKRILVDTNVLVEMWRNPRSGPPVLQQSSKSINTITYIEFVQGTRLRDKQKAKEFLQIYDHLRLDAATCDTAIQLIEKHSETDGLRLADALIAATCLVHDLELVTLNRRHFQKIANLKLI